MALWHGQGLPNVMSKFVGIAIALNLVKTSNYNRENK